jgi:hypothetical protein
MSAYQPKSPDLTNSPLFRKAAANPDLGLGYMTGAIETIPARKGQPAALERRGNLTALDAMAPANAIGACLRLKPTSKG